MTDTGLYVAGGRDPEALQKWIINCAVSRALLEVAEYGCRVQYRSTDVRYAESEATICIDRKEYEGIRIGDPVCLQRGLLVPPFSGYNFPPQKNDELTFRQERDLTFHVVLFVEVVALLNKLNVKSMYCVLTRYATSENIEICRQEVRKKGKLGIGQGELTYKVSLYWVGSLHKLEPAPKKESEGLIRIV